MTREILTYPVTESQIWCELEYFVEHFWGAGHRDCQVLFGFAWGNEYYPSGEWRAVTIPLEGLVAEIRRVEVSGLGSLGSDDLFISIPGLDFEFRFCNDSDMHIRFEKGNETTELFYQRWKEHGFSPTEWQKTAEGKTGECLRFN
jgi:hypothetical protein